MLKDLLKVKTKMVSQPDEKSGEYHSEIPEGLWKKCNKCNAPIYTEDVIKGRYICPKCKGYFRMPADVRILDIVDPESFIESDFLLAESNPLQFPGYEKKQKEVKERTGLSEAVITGTANVGGIKTALAVMDARYFMGSMGYQVGEAITQMLEQATKEELPVILFTCSGGARMQEGIISLMQMAKTSAAMKKHSDAGLLSIVVLTDPTTGGVTASFAMLGDIILAEEGALIGFAGPRVIEQTIKQKLPVGFQRAEFLEEHGFVDAVVSRDKMRETLVLLLLMHQQTTLDEQTHFGSKKALERMGKVMQQQAEPTPWERVELSRLNSRLTATDYAELLFDDFVELHGDRAYSDDKAIIGGIAMFHGQPVTLIMQQKGKTTKDNVYRNFAMPSPDGYRKALRLMKEAEKFHRPVICFVDTPGAFCGIEAEERGQGEAIARNLYEMSTLKTPIVSLVIGEGGSGGALALAVADEVWMMENAVYSILSPEGFATILWKDSKRAPEAAKAMKITAKDLLDLGVIEAIIPEPEPAGEGNKKPISSYIASKLDAFIRTYQAKDGDVLIEERYQRFRQM